MRGSAWELKFDAERGLLGGFGVLFGSILRVWKALGGSKCRTVRVWKLKTSINTSHLLGFGRPKVWHPRGKSGVPGVPLVPRYLRT